MIANVYLGRSNELKPLDLPESAQRAPVTRPVRFAAAGVLACLHQVRLYRDLHYLQAGIHDSR